MKLEQTQVRVPRWQRRWWQFGEDSLEYRCPACGQFHLLRISRFGWALYAALAVSMLLVWKLGVHRMGVVGAGLVAAALLFRHAVELRAAHMPSAGK